MKTKKLNLIQTLGIIVITLLLGVFTKNFVLGQLRPAGQYMTGLTVPVSGDIIRSVRGQRVHNFIDRWKTDTNLLTNLNIGATKFCDQDGLNCYTITGLVAGDNLGNHSATQNIRMKGNRISNDGQNEGIIINDDGDIGINFIPVINYRLSVDGSTYIYSGITIGNLGGAGDTCIYANNDGSLLSTGCSTFINSYFSGGDNLGNHIATQNIQTNTNRISNNGNNEGIMIDNFGKILISNNTNGTTPLAQLHIRANKSGSTKGDILAEGEVGAIGLPTNGFGTRFMRLPNISSLVAGTVTGTQRDSIGSYSFIFGKNNIISSSVANSSIAGGESNTIASSYGFIGGGGGNTILPGSIGSSIGGGGFNTGDGVNITIGGGQYNQINSDLGFIGGGGYNKIRGIRSVIGGGYSNEINLASSSVIGGGLQNSITGSNTNSVIGGGYSNTINGNYSTIPGGNDNSINGDYSVALGDQARVATDHTFFWNGDPTNLSTVMESGTFIIRSPNGVGINVWNPAGFTLYVNGTSRLKDKVYIGTNGGVTNVYITGDTQINNGGINGATHIKEQGLLRGNPGQSCTAAQEGSIVYDKTASATTGRFMGCACNTLSTSCLRQKLSN